jgi:fatty-acid peroxygenase
VIDRTLQVLARGYPALGDLRRRGQGHDQAPATGVELRLLGRSALCVGGAEGVRLFYDEHLTTRVGALPGPVRATLFGNGTVHGLDGGAHLHRKALFLAVLGPGAAERLAATAEVVWGEALGRWTDTGTVDLFDEAVLVLGSAVCRWAGIPATRTSDALYRDLATIVDGFGSVGRRHLAARAARRRANSWAADLVADVRAGRVTVAENSPVAVIAGWSEVTGVQLALPIAAVELLNILRPTVAVAWFVTAAASVPEQEAHWRETVAGGDGNALASFVHEVRRLTPFAPMLAARARTTFEWEGHVVHAGRLIVLDIYGTLRTPATWVEPLAFRPDRFAGPCGAGAFSDAYVPHGGGEPVHGHRCPGEPATVALMEGAVRQLAGLDYEVVTRPPRRLSRMPARVAVLLTNVAPAAPRTASS